MKSYGRRAAGAELSDSDLRELKTLAEMPEGEIDFSDISERNYDLIAAESSANSLPLEDHTITLRVDAEVAAWLEAAGKKDPHQINLVLKRAAQRSKLLETNPHLSLDKAS